MSVKKTLLELEEVGFLERFFKNLLDSGTLFIVFMIVFSYLKISTYLSIMLLIFWIIYILKRYNEAKVYITKIFIDEENLVISYCFKDNHGFERKIPLKQVKINWFDSIKGNINGGRCCFYQNEDKLLTQYFIGDWTKRKTKSIMKLINDLDIK